MRRDIDPGGAVEENCLVNGDPALIRPL